MLFRYPEINICLPEWTETFPGKYPETIVEKRDRMEMVVDLSRQNVRYGTGGPFAAAVVDEKGTLVAPGVNMVIPENNAMLHAEMVALMFAQKTLGTYDLGFGGTRRLILFTSTEPCAMCFGALCWSGISALVCGAKSCDAEAIGFDEGPRHPEWVRELTARGIGVTLEVCREEAAAVHKEYAEAGGIIYNP